MSFFNRGDKHQDTQPFRCEPNSNGPEGSQPEDAKWERIEGQKKLKFRCKICPNEKHEKMWRIRDHVRHMHDNKLYDCPEPACPSEFPRRDTRRLHVKSFHPKLLDQVTDTNPRGYGGQEEDQHIERYLVEKKWFYTCKFTGCGSGAPVSHKIAELREHIRKAHSENIPMTTSEKPFGCSDCGERYSDPTGLRQHMKYQHSLETDMLHQCECGEEFQVSAEATRHCLRKNASSLNTTHNYISREMRRDILVSAFAEETRLITVDGTVKYVWELQKGDMLQGGNGDSPEVVQVNCRSGLASQLTQVTDHQEGKNGKKAGRQMLFSLPEPVLSYDQIKGEEIEEEVLKEAVGLHPESGTWDKGTNPLCRVNFRGAILQPPNIASGQEWRAKLDFCILENRPTSGWFRRLCMERGIYDDRVYDAAWILGLWLGDGMWSKLNIACDKNHTEQIESIEKAGDRLGLQMSRLNLYAKRPGFQTKAHVAVNVSLHPPEKDNNGNPLLRLIYQSGACGLNESNRKRFPPELVSDEREVVEHVLAGLIDSDGHVLTDESHRNGYNVAITTIYPQMKDMLVQAGRYLGLGTSVVQRDSRENTVFGFKVISKDYFDVRYTGTRLGCILAKCNVKHKYRKYPEIVPKKRRRHIINIAPPLPPQMYENLYEIVLKGGKRVMVSSGIVVPLAQPTHEGQPVSAHQVRELRRRYDEQELSHRKEEKKREDDYIASCADWKRGQLTWIRQIQRESETSKHHPHFAKAKDLQSAVPLPPATPNESESPEAAMASASKRLRTG